MKQSDSFGNQSSYEYYDSGMLKTINHQTSYGKKTTLQFSQDQQEIEVIDEEGKKRSLIFDELGQLKGIRNGEKVVLLKTYGNLIENGVVQTNQWMEKTETKYKTTELVFNKSFNLIKINFTGNNGTNGQIRSSFEYENESGELNKMVSEGLVELKRFFEKGQLIKEVIGDSSNSTTMSYHYDKNNRVKKIRSGEKDIRFTYGTKGELRSINNRKGKFKQKYTYENGSLVKLEDSNQRADTFDNDSEGNIQEVKRADGEHWVIKRDKDKIAHIRNGVVQENFNFDSNGLLKGMTY